MVGVGGVAPPLREQNKVLSDEVGEGSLAIGGVGLPLLDFALNKQRIALLDVLFHQIGQLSEKSDSVPIR